MTLSANSVAIGKVICNGVELAKAYMNGVLVFEMEATLTIGSDSNYYGLVGSGILSSNSVSGYSGQVVELYWEKHQYDAVFHVMLSPAPYPAKLTVTIGTEVMTVLIGDWGEGAKVLSVNTLPTSGTVKVKFEAIA